MHKNYLIVIIILLLTDICLLYYLNYLEINRIGFSFNDNSKLLIYQKKDLILDNIDNFNVSEYFNILSFDNENINNKIEQDNIIIDLNNIKYNFKYTIKKPEIIEKVVYKEIESKNKNIDTHTYTEENYFYVDNYTFTYSLDTDLEQIRQDLINNINTTYETSVDYSQLNTSQIGQYSVFYLTNDKKIEIFINIV